MCVGFEPKGLLIQQWIKKPGFRTGHGFQRLVDIKNREFGKMRGEKVVFFGEKLIRGGKFKKYTDRIGKLIRSQSLMVNESAEHIFKKYTDQNSEPLLNKQ